MDPTVGPIPAPAAVTAYRFPARTGDRPVQTLRNGDPDNEYRWAPTWVAR